MSPDSALPPTDEALASSLRQGDDTALNTLMERWQSPLRGFLYRMLQNEHDALDLAQETFVRIYRHRANYRAGARFSTWMFQIALNLARDHARRRTRRPTDSLDDTPEPFDERNPGSDALAAERARTVRTAIAALPEDLRVALIFSEYDDKSHAQIAVIVGATPKAVETRIYRAREILRKKLAKFMA
ncbi:MAG TPA: sigma-70 family RNA polymerase sigma factor [Rariglobus sp.]|jgi:RNA polymerase sigma-70 factor (ECF subfamily)|nr:sigma-70 family RNA polymerase sigma factor [Rariglobus sp.]